VDAKAIAKRSGATAKLAANTNTRLPLSGKAIIGSRLRRKAYTVSRKSILEKARTGSGTGKGKRKNANSLRMPRNATKIADGTGINTYGARTGDARGKRRLDTHMNTAGAERRRRHNQRINGRKSTAVRRTARNSAVQNIIGATQGNRTSNKTTSIIAAVITANRRRERNNLGKRKREQKKQKQETFSKFKNMGKNRKAIIATALAATIIFATGYTLGKHRTEQSTEQSTEAKAKKIEKEIEQIQNNIDIIRKQQEKTFTEIEPQITKEERFRRKAEGKKLTREEMFGKKYIKTIDSLNKALKEQIQHKQKLYAEFESLTSK